MTASAYAGRYSIYTGRVTNWLIIALSVVLAVPLLVLGSMSRGDSRDLAVLLLVTAGVIVANVLTGSSVRTSAGPTGVRIRFGVIGWPRGTYRLDRIARAEVVDVPVWRVAFGYWWTPSHTHCTVRSGPALRLTLRSGRLVTVTVQDAHAALAAIREAMA